MHYGHEESPRGIQRTDAAVALDVALLHDRRHEIE
jgi:hypothetical protein